MSSISVGRIQGGFVLRVREHGTLRESRALTEFLSHVPAGTQVDLDLGQATYVDSTFLGSLMGLHKRLNVAGGGRFRVCGPREAVRRLMGKTRLDTVLPMVEEASPVQGEEQVIPVQHDDPQQWALYIADAHRKLAELGGPDSAAFRKVAEQLEEESRRHHHT